ncbi:MAG: zf-HC2 domain-containing protein [Gemmatimonadota bacterium]
MLSCKEVLARHSEYVDGELTAAEAERLRAHLAECALCARYDRVLRRGVSLLNVAPELEPGSEFDLHLRNRLADEAQRMALRPVSQHAAIGVSIAATLALIAWLPFMLASGGGSTPTMVRVNALANGVTSSEIAWHGEAALQQEAHTNPSAPAAPTLESTHIQASIVDPGYTPLVIEAPTAPPSYSSVRLTSFQPR